MVSAVVELMDPVAAFVSVIFIEILIALRRNFRFERKIFSASIRFFKIGIILRLFYRKS